MVAKTLQIPGSSKKIHFDLDDPHLPKAIADEALESGDYPYRKRMKREAYERELELLQIELLKLQQWTRTADQRILILFEGRDAAGKGGTIRRIMHHLNPRHARAVALSKPTDIERGQWYFQRYVEHLPSAGNMVLFDRSWYNRAGVERVMGFCTPQQLEKFLHEVPHFEAQLVRDGILLFKIWLTIGREMQLKRFHRRHHDPLRQWKLSDMDLAAIAKWDEYTEAKEDLFRQTHTKLAPWTVVRANDKRRTRINVIRYILSSIDYPEKDFEVVDAPDDKIVGSGKKFFFDA
jgi:polyphosphate kinase 2